MADKTAASSFSGGLDSALVVILLKEKYGYGNVVPVLLDVGQGDAEVERALGRGAMTS